MLPSVEARWFMAGPAPMEALRWIQAWELQPGEQASKPEERQDHYLRLPGIASIGIKVRDGKFEVKRRDVNLGLVTLAPRAIGHLALWRKWSARIADGGGNKAPDGYWVTVDKERYLRKYSVENAGLKVVDPRSFPAHGCTIELTCIHVGGTKWWSVGFEAFGPAEGELRDTLALVAANCFNPEDYPTLAAEDSFDYPDWLSSLLA